MGFLRTLCGLVALSAGIFYLTAASSLSDNGSWSLIGITFGATFAWVLLGGRGAKKPTQVQAALPVSDLTEEVDEEIATDTDLPPPVTAEDNLDGVSLRERKLAKIQAAQQQDTDSEDNVEDAEDIETVEVTLENVHTADEYVVEVTTNEVIKNKIVNTEKYNANIIIKNYNA